MYELLCQLDSLSSKNRLHINDRNNLAEKLGRMKQRGSSELQAIIDFDRTLARYKKADNTFNSTSFGVFESDPDFNKEEQKKLCQLTDKYRPIEIDPSMSHDEKEPFMLEWWIKSQEIMVESKVTKKGIQICIDKSDLALRDRVADFFARFKSKNCPILIFSAGLGDIIKGIIEKFKINHECVHIFGNFMEFDESGVIKGFQKPLIHVFNKMLATVPDSERYKVAKSTILIGDSTGDVHMHDGGLEFDNGDNCSDVLRIGFLNSNVEAYLNDYKKIYDIVLVDDETFDVPNLIVDFITVEK